MQIPAHYWLLFGVTNSEFHRGLAGSRKERPWPGGTLMNWQAHAPSKAPIPPAGGDHVEMRAQHASTSHFSREAGIKHFLNANSLKF